MLMVLLQSLTRLLLQALNIMFRIRNLFSIGLDLSFPNSSAYYHSIHAVILTSSMFQPIAPKDFNGTYGRLGIATQLPLPMALAFLLLVQLIIFVVVDLGFPVVCVLVYN